MRNGIFKIGGNLGGFQVFFLILEVNPCFWVKNGGRHVNLRGMGNIDKKNASKNDEKRA